MSRPPRIALIHATPLAIAPVNEAFARLWPAAERMNLLDDSLSADRAAAGALTDAMIDRFRALAGYCVEHGSAGVLFTCSAFGPAIEAARSAVSVPVLKPNEAMMVEALGLAARGSGRVALLATFAPTIESVTDEFRKLSAARGVAAELVTHHVAGAMAALDAGDAPRHDALIANALEHWDAWRDCGAILLAQFSMARAKSAVAERAGIPVLVSTDSAVVAMRRALGA
jgi:hypothetical protein